MNELEILKSLSENNRNQFRQNLIKAKKTADNQQEFSATFIGYDSATGRYVCQKQDGSIVHALSITNSGIAKGSKVSLSISATGIPTIDGMPR